MNEERNKLRLTIEMFENRLKRYTESIQTAERNGDDKLVAAYLSVYKDAQEKLTELRKEYADKF